MFEICNCEFDNGIHVNKIKDMIKNNSKGLEYIEIFCCSTENTSKKNNFSDVDKN
jgi:hypothetical protein